MGKRRYGGDEDLAIIMLWVMEWVGKSGKVVNLLRLKGK
jgi:hypothetical protein